MFIFSKLKNSLKLNYFLHTSKKKLKNKYSIIIVKYFFKIKGTFFDTECVRYETYNTENIKCIRNIFYKF